MKSQSDVWYDQAQQSYNLTLKQKLEQAIIQRNRDIANSKSSKVQQWLNKLNPTYQSIDPMIDPIEQVLADFSKDLTVEYMRHIEHLVCVERNLDHPDVLRYNEMYGNQLDDETLDLIFQLTHNQHHT